MKIPGVDVDKHIEEATTPILDRLDALQCTLDALLALEQARDVERVRREQRGERD